MKRITVDVPDDLHEQLRSRLPWGLRRHLFESVMRLIVEAVERDGYVVAGAIIDRRYKLVKADEIPRENSAAPAGIGRTPGPTMAGGPEPQDHGHDSGDASPDEETTWAVGET